MASIFLVSFNYTSMTILLPDESNRLYIVKQTSLGRKTHPCQLLTYRAIIACSTIRCLEQLSRHETTQKTDDNVTRH